MSELAGIGRRHRFLLAQSGPRAADVRYNRGRKENRMNFTRGLLLTILICAAGRTVHAQGILIVMKQTSAGTTDTSRSQFDKDHLRIEARTKQVESANIFDAQTQIFREVNHDQK